MRLERDPSAFNYIKNSTDNNQTSINDKTDYKAVMSAMSILGFTQMETKTIWNIVSGVLHLVNMFANNVIFFFYDNFNEFFSLLTF